MSSLHIEKKNEIFHLKGLLGENTLNLKKYDKNGFYSVRIDKEESTIGDSFSHLNFVSLLLNKDKNQSNHKTFELISHFYKCNTKEKCNISNSLSKSLTFKQRINTEYWTTLKNFLEIPDRKNKNKNTHKAMQATPWSKEKSSRELGILNSIYLQRISGVSRGYLTYLRVVGIGFRVFFHSKKENTNLGNMLTFKLGFSHLVKVQIPNSIQVFLPEPTLICLYGLDKNQVTQIAAKIQQIKKPSVYKGKGIRLLDVPVRLKTGKKKS